MYQTQAHGMMAGTARRGEWQLVGRYPTAEMANKVISELARDGVDSRVALIDGLCVLARMPHGT